MITLWGRKTSSNVQVVTWTLAELGLEHQRIDAGGPFGGLDTPDYLAMNPNAKIPTLKDGGLVVWESAACLRYLGARYGGPEFWPEDPGARARLDMWAEWVKTTWTPVVQAGIFWMLVRTPRAERDPARLARLAEEAKQLAAMLDAAIGEGPWLGGESFTFADIMTGHLLYRYYTLEVERAELPALAAYYRRLVDRPAYAEHVMVSYESLMVD